ncbi:FadR/GntR family transcriptional regulator [Actinacidiphila oryziradicis]|uniref:FadR/GntR family transcriptional regulator n=1 Tax=Actinacidiphila oryziradicis TaxID=2571141 RepID=UPI0023F14726|nr:FadR/GntR family transcriptional regulator [Actinacidiphila oryziradicis]MCW2874827.1 transcriptional regulator, GntR family [Actinacidiphila oryziradicis]
MTQRRTVGVDVPRVQPRSIGDEVAARLEKLIVVGDLKPGDRLPSERELAIGLNVSRASLREAMHELEAKHLIERRPGRGTTVLPAPEHVTSLYAKVSGKEREVREVAELREAVEPRLARYAAVRATDANLIALTDVLAEADGEISQELSLRLDLEFHLLVAQAADSALMASLITLMASWTKSTRELSHATVHARNASYRGHREILDAINARDGDAAEAAMTAHLVEVSVLTRANLRRRRGDSNVRAASDPDQPRSARKART